MVRCGQVVPDCLLGGNMKGGSSPSFLFMRSVIKAETGRVDLDGD